MEFSIRILVAIVLTMFFMHGLTVFMILFHKDKVCKHAQQIKSWFERKSSSHSPRTTIRPVTDVNMAPKDFDDMFGIVTGIEAMDESYYLR